MLLPRACHSATARSCRARLAMRLRWRGSRCLTAPVSRSSTAGRDSLGLPGPLSAAALKPLIAMRTRWGAVVARTTPWMGMTTFKAPNQPAKSRSTLTVNATPDRFRVAIFSNCRPSVVARSWSFGSGGPPPNHPRSRNAPSSHSAEAAAWATVRRTRTSRP